MADVKYVKGLFNAGLETSVSPSGVNDVTNKAYVDAAVAGATNHLEAARVEADANVDIVTGGLLTIDGVTLVAGDRVLLTAQTDPIDNGVYVAASGAWSRASDVDTGATIAAGTDIFIEEGTEHGDHVQALSAEAVVGTDAQTWVHISTHTNEAENVTYDPTGNTTITGTDVQAALDQADAAIASGDTRIDSLSGVTGSDLGTFTGTTISDNTDIKTALQELETAHESIDVSGQIQTFYDGQKATLTGQTINANTWTTFTHSVDELWPSAINIYDMDGKLLTDAFNIDIIDANSIRVENQTATVFTDMVVVVRA